MADDDKVIVSACESTPYGISTDVQRQDRFWIKSQPYSLEDMLADDDSVDQFVGGTVYQAFLSATNYHRPGTALSSACSSRATPASPRRIRCAA